jgi:Flp pilus assembly pilin Flp
VIETQQIVSPPRRRADEIDALTTDTTASTAMEYALVGSLISVAIIGALSATGSGVADKWNTFTNTVIAVLR